MKSRRRGKSRRLKTRERNLVVNSLSHCLQKKKRFDYKGQILTSIDLTLFAQETFADVSIECNTLIVCETLFVVKEALQPLSSEISSSRCNFACF